MSERKRFNTPNHNLNSTVCYRKTSASKKYSPATTRGTLLNETVSYTPHDIPNIKAPVTTGIFKTQIIETEYDLAFNEYLQSLLKYEIVEKSIKDQDTLLKGQILFQQNNLNKRVEVLRNMQRDTELLVKKEEVVKVIQSLEDHINKIKNMYSIYQTQTHVDTLHSALEEKTKFVTLKNIHPVTTQDQCNKFVDALKRIATDCEKVICCNRDFEGVNSLAEECRNLKQIVKKLGDSQVLLATTETQAVGTILRTLSDGFAKQYQNIED